MSILVLVSILIRALNFVLSMVIVWRIRDWRLSFLPLMMILTVLRQTLHMVEQGTIWHVSWQMPGSEVPGLLLSVITFLMLLVMQRIFWERDQAIHRLKQAETEREAFVQELEAKNAELERFTYTVSHDLKSPLVTIRGFLGLLERDIANDNPSGVKRDIEKIHAAAATMGQLLNELLELSRVGATTKLSEEVQLSELAAEAAELVAGRISERGVKVEIAADLPTVLGDPSRLREVLQNLIDNGVKFMGEQPAPRLKIGGKVVDGENIFFVRDNGLGVEPAYREKIFGLFDRLDPTIEGTGVGLALVKRIIEVHGGRIWLESEGHGQGSTFFFTLPSHSN